MQQHSYRLPYKGVATILVILVLGLMALVSPACEGLSLTTADVQEAVTGLRVTVEQVEADLAALEEANPGTADTEEVVALKMALARLRVVLATAEARLEQAHTDEDIARVALESTMPFIPAPFNYFVVAGAPFLLALWRAYKNRQHLANVVNGIDAGKDAATGAINFADANYASRIETTMGPSTRRLVRHLRNGGSVSPI